jgi:hypothetical protein
MTDKAISPLRQRLIDDIAIRRLGPKTQHDYLYPPRQKLCRFRWPLSRQGRRGGCPPVSAAAGVDRSDGTDRQRRRLCVAVLLRGHAEAPRSCRRGRVGARASPPPCCSQPGRGRSTAGVGDEHQAQGRAKPDLCHRPASIGGHITEAKTKSRTFVLAAAGV